jgi:hypothetical protein
MKLKTLGIKATVVTLCIALVYAPCAAGFDDKQLTEQQRLETCRRLLESVGSPNKPLGLAASVKPTHDRRSVVDLTDTDVQSFKSATAAAKVDDILVINEKRLMETQFTSALEESPAIFSVATGTGTGPANSILESRAGQPEIIVAIPTSAIGVEKVFGVPASVSAATVKYLVDTSQQFHALKNSHLLNYATNGRPLSEVLVSKAKQNSSDPLILVAHNERGLLKFPDGSSIRVDALYHTLGNRVGIVLSCDTIHSENAPNNFLLTNRELDFRDVVRGLRSAEEGLSANPDLSLGSLLFQFSKNIPQNDSSSAQKVKVVALVVGGLIVLALLYYWICEDSTSASPLCPSRGKSDSPKKDEGKADDKAIR